jgi:hypothetical protein
MDLIFVADIPHSALNSLYTLDCQWQSSSHLRLGLSSVYITTLCEIFMRYKDTIIGSPIMSKSYLSKREHVIVSILDA